jgi:RES domain-containing protein
MGGLKTSARWHTRGHRIAYLSSTPASALLEILVHLEIEEDHLPRFYKLLEIQAPDSIRIEKIDWAMLPKGWPKKQSITQTLGDQWLERNSSALLEVPSALVPHTSNFLLNPAHKDATKILVASVSKQGLDRRLLM